MSIILSTRMVFMFHTVGVIITFFYFTLIWLFFLLYLFNLYEQKNKNKNPTKML